MKEKLTALNATITTASVEVKTLTISGKQVTLAVFRQLPHRTLIDPDTLDFRGIPWGHVNYHPGMCTRHFPPREHLHVVWQSEACLHVDTVYRSREWARIEELKRMQDDLRFAELNMLMGCPTCDGVIDEVSLYPQLFRCNEGGHDFPVREMPALRAEIKRLTAKTLLSPQTLLDEAFHRGHRIIEASGRYEQFIIEHEEWRKRWESQYALLESLDQLFIAV